MEAVKSEIDHISKKTDCAFTGNNIVFRLRSCGIIIENGCVLMVKNSRDPYYYSVGGAVHHGEDTAAAAVREVYEETGELYEIDRLCFIHENFFTIGTERWHEVAFYYLMKKKGIKEFKNESKTHDNFTERMCWIPLDDYSSCKAYPEFFAEKLKGIEKRNDVERIVTAEN